VNDIGWVDCASTAISALLARHRHEGKHEREMHAEPGCLRIVL